MLPRILLPLFFALVAVLTLSGTESRQTEPADDSLTLNYSKSLTLAYDDEDDDAFGDDEDDDAFDDDKRKKKKKKKKKKVKQKKNKEKRDFSSSRSSVSGSRKSSSAVGEAIADLPLFNKKKVNTRAKYYIYLCSASWCGPCNKEMPNVVKAYKKMRSSKKVELLFVGYDDEQEQAEAFLDKFRAKFPAVMKDDAKGLPGYMGANGIPHAIFVDADGTLVKRGHGKLVAEWNEIIDEYEEQNAPADGDDDDDE